MPTWNRYEVAVYDEIQVLRSYGYPEHGRSLPPVTSYQAQALRELAHRLLLWERLQEVRAQLNQALDRCEAAARVYPAPQEAP